jgi:hypothetical protein
VLPLTSSLRRRRRCLCLPHACSGKLAGMVAGLLSPDLFVGLVFGLVLGLLIGPIVRSWLIWREWVSASKEAHLVADVLDRMEVVPWTPPEPDGRAPGGRAPEGDAPNGRTKDAVRQGTSRRDVP